MQREKLIKHNFIEGRISGINAAIDTVESIGLSCDSQDWLARDILNSLRKLLDKEQQCSEK